MINSRIVQDSEWMSQIWKLYSRGSKDSYILLLNQLSYTQD
jgi:hypothetical protein